MTEVEMIRAMKPKWGDPPNPYKVTVRRLFVDWNSDGENLAGIDLGTSRRSTPYAEIDNPRWLDLEGTPVACYMTALAGEYYVSACREYVGIIGNNYGRSIRPFCHACTIAARQATMDGR